MLVRGIGVTGVVVDVFCLLTRAGIRKDISISFLMTYSAISLHLFWKTLLEYAYCD